MNTKTPITCRKCGLYPNVETVKLDGKKQRKCSCPKCGLAIYTPLKAEVDCVDRWNAVNEKKRMVVRPNMRSSRPLASAFPEADAGLGWASPLSSMLEDENYCAFADNSYPY